MNHRSLTRFAWLAVAAAIATITLKAGASLLTSSVGLLSDTLESFVNLASALIALAMLTVAARPADNDHPYGHGKAEYFSSILEGALILVAAGAIGITAVQRLLHPRSLEQIGLGLAISVVAALLNLAVGLVLLRAGRRYRSVTLEANAQHLLTDVWTSAGVLVGVGAAGLTGWLPLDPILALVVAGNIVATGVRLVRRSVSGLMDAALPPEDQQALLAELARYADLGVQFHALRTRQAGARRFVSLHVLVPGDWTVQRGHKLLEDVETGIRTVLPSATVFTHLEPSDDPASWEDVGLDRGTSGDVSRV
jgi:cation diffusion facilitator family transporter